MSTVYTLWHWATKFGLARHTIKECIFPRGEAPGIPNFGVKPIYAYSPWHITIKFGVVSGDECFMGQPRSNKRLDPSYHHFWVPPYAIYAFLTTTRHGNAHGVRRGFRCVPRRYPRGGAPAHINFLGTHTYAHAFWSTATESGMVTRAGWEC